MTTVFLGDSFSLDETRLLGRPIANRALVRAILLCDQIERVVAVGDPAVYQSLGDLVTRKLQIANSLPGLLQLFRDNIIDAVFCSSFGMKYAQLVYFRNTAGASCPVYGFTHTLSYQDEVGAWYRMYCAGVRAQDGILCTSRAAINVVTKQMAVIRKTLALDVDNPRLVHFPLACEAASPLKPVKRSGDYLQVLFIGRLNWNSKADVLIIPRIARLLPSDHRVRFVIAGAADNPQYIQLLQQQSQGLPVRVVQNVSDEQKQHLYQQSHVMFSPSDNYQETFGLTVIEAKRQGCVPVVSDFDGYRDLVEDGVDGRLLPTCAARVPQDMFDSQILMPNDIYHGWWAAGVSIDAAETADVLYGLSQDHEVLNAMSASALETSGTWSLDQAAARFGQLVEEARSNPALDPGRTRVPNPFHIDYSDIFCGYPTCFWSDQQLQVTPQGQTFMNNPAIEAVPQVMQLSDFVQLTELVDAIGAVVHQAQVSRLLTSGVEPLLLSVLLKNGLIKIGAD
ncbi:MAG TPA: glycosyltransferase [Gammaproteobacteria bacterium]|nr:glycosyltransferase [Gammaproteobacteria bacterium]